MNEKACPVAKMEKLRQTPRIRLRKEYY
jgi:hypothetical protein